MRRFLRITAFGLVGGVILTVVASAGAMEGLSTDTSCADVEFVWVRGSGQEIGTSGEWAAYKEKIEAQMEWKELSAKYEFYEVGYPAVGIDAVTAAEAWVSQGYGWDYGESMRTGVTNLVDHVRRQMEGCPNERFVLAGYSQGAQVVAESLRDLDAYRVIYAALLGEPKLFLPEGRQTWPFAPEACSGKSSEYRMWAPNCYTYEGSLAARRPYALTGWEGRVGLYCNSHDFVCGSSAKPWDNDGHGKYAERMVMVAAKVTTEVARVLPAKKITQEKQGVASMIRRQAPMDTVILIDSTGSMQLYIDAYKNKALELAKQTIEAGGRVALAEYRDFEDEGYPKLLCGLGCDAEQFSDLLGGIMADGGGDDDEGLLAAMMFVYDTLAWEEGATKSLIVLTDAGYHSPDKSGVTHEEVVARSLEIDPVNTYVITPVSGLYDLDKLARDTGGRMFRSSRLTNEFFDGVVEEIVGRPVALLALGEYWTEVGGSLYFDASGSYGVGHEIMCYDWDFDGDGEYEVKCGGAEMEHKYEDGFEGFVVVKAIDKYWREATMSAKVRIGGEPPEWEEPWRPEGVEVSSEETGKTEWGLDRDQDEVRGDEFGGSNGYLGEIGVPATGVGREKDVRNAGTVMLELVTLVGVGVGLSCGAWQKWRGK